MDGTCVLLNARRSGRFHCRFTGPYYLLMIAPTLALGSMDAPLHAWLVLAALVLLGDKIIWWATELAWPTTGRGIWFHSHQTGKPGCRLQLKRQTLLAKYTEGPT